VALARDLFSGAGGPHGVDIVGVSTAGALGLGLAFGAYALGRGFGRRSIGQ
jgi:hypothetical protein